MKTRGLQQFNERAAELTCALSEIWTLLFKNFKLRISFDESTVRSLQSTDDFIFMETGNALREVFKQLLILQKTKYNLNFINVFLAKKSDVQNDQLHALSRSMSVVLGLTIPNSNQEIYNFFLKCLNFIFRQLLRELLTSFRLLYYHQIHLNSFEFIWILGTEWTFQLLAVKLLKLLNL